MKHILMNIILPCAAALTLSSCIDDYEGTAESEKDTYIHLNVSTAALQTRASDESAANPNTESDIHSVRVWAFNSDLTAEGVLPVSYKEETNLSKNSSYTLSMKIPRNSGGTELKNLDLFILANAESGSKLHGNGFSPKEVTRKTLQEAKLSDKFVVGTDGKPTDASVPNEGLPISRYVTGIDVDSYKSETESSSSAKSLSIPMQRAVSKLHFFFARKTGSDAAQAEVTKIELDGGNLSKGSYVFPEGADYAQLSTEGMKKTNGTMEYISDKATLLGVSSENIPAVEEPKEYIRSEEEDASAYLARLSKAGITSQDLAYYNETDKAISGTIYYKVYGSEHSKSFTIPAEYTSRNHELLVYGYFNAEGHLELNYAILDWDQTANTTVETKDLSYLNVYPTLVFMRNVEKNQEVNFSASNACTVTIEEVYYYDKNNNKKTISSGSDQYPIVTITDGAKQGKVSISSKVPTNLSVKYIRIKVTSGDKSQEVLVKQYPLEYIQAIDGWYSTKSIEGWIDWGNDHERTTTNKTSSDNNFQAKVYTYVTYQYWWPTTSGTYIWAYNYDESTQKAQLSGAPITAQSNNHMYVVQITETDGTYTIGHVNNIDETTKLSDENVVSPAFSLASQLGTVAAFENDREQWSSGQTAGQKAAQHCADYVEVATDGTRYKDWRLPTEAEIGVIVKYQYNQSQDVMSEVLRGHSYWALSGKTVTANSSGSGQGYVRCVRDLPPDEVTKLENSKK